MKQYTVYIFTTEESATLGASPEIVEPIQIDGPLDAIFSVLHMHGLYSVFAAFAYDGGDLMAELVECSFSPSSRPLLWRLGRHS